MADDRAKTIASVLLSKMQLYQKDLAQETHPAVRAKITANIQKVTTLLNSSGQIYQSIPAAARTKLRTQIVLPSLSPPTSELSMPLVAVAPVTADARDEDYAPCANPSFRTVSLIGIA